MVLPHLGKKTQEQSFTFNCHIKGRRKSFAVSISGTASVKELIQSINQQGGLTLDPDALERTDYWKVDIPIDGPLEGIRQEDYPPGILLNNTARTISTIWKEQPSNINIDIFVQLPKKERHAGTGVILAQYLCPANEEAITFTIPSRDGFSNLKMSDISEEEVEQATHIFPYLKAFLEALEFPRVVLPDTILATLPAHMSAAFGNFNNYFQRASSRSSQSSEADNIVTQSEGTHYLHVLFTKGHLSEKNFVVDKHAQINAVFLQAPTGEFSHGSRQAHFRTSWSFPLLAALREDKYTKFRYTPMSDFRLEIRKFPHFILEVVSTPNQADRWRMLLQASCLARLGNKLRKSSVNEPVIIMATYIDLQMTAHEYLVYQPDMSHKKVLYHETHFNLSEPRTAFKFLFRLYNFLARAAIENDKLIDSLEEELDTVKNGVPHDQYSALTSERSPDDGGANPPKRPRRADGRMGNRSVQRSLKAAGYEPTPMDSTSDLVPITRLKPNMCDATSLDGTHVVLKIVDDKTDELKILKYLNDIKSAANHTIELHGTILNSIANVVALRWRIPLEDYFSPPTPELASFPEQFLEAVAFLHERGVAHMDLKPGNVVVDGMDRDRPPRILIIDFDLSIFVEGEDTMTEGFCGTPPWIAPEVGMPNMKYSAILADRWACGRMVCYLQEQVPPGCGTTNWTRDAIQERIRSLLMSDDPRSRRPLKNVLEAYRRGSVKRIAAKAEEGEETRKRARASVSLVDPIRGASQPQNHVWNGFQSNALSRDSAATPSQWEQDSFETLVARADSSLALGPLHLT